MSLFTELASLYCPTLTRAAHSTQLAIPPANADEACSALESAISSFECVVILSSLLAEDASKATVKSAASRAKALVAEIRESCELVEGKVPADEDGDSEEDLASLGQDQDQEVGKKDRTATLPLLTLKAVRGSKDTVGRSEDSKLETVSVGAGLVIGYRIVCGADIGNSVEAEKTPSLATAAAEHQAGLAAGEARGLKIEEGRWVIDWQGMAT